MPRPMEVRRGFSQPAEQRPVNQERNEAADKQCPIVRSLGREESHPDDWHQHRLANDP